MNNALSEPSPRRTVESIDDSPFADAGLSLLARCFTPDLLQRCWYVRFISLYYESSDVLPELVFSDLPRLVRLFLLEPTVAKLIIRNTPVLSEVILFGSYSEIHIENCHLKQLKLSVHDDQGQCNCFFKNATIDELVLIGLNGTVHLDVGSTYKKVDSTISRSVQIRAMQPNGQEKLCFSHPPTGWLAKCKRLLSLCF